MPRLRFHPFVSTSLLVAALVLFSASVLLAQPMTNPQAGPAKGVKTMTWVLTDGKVINSGKTEGNLTTGFVVEATATAQGPARVRTGKFTIRCTIQEKDGKFLLRGTWDITRAGAARTTRRSPNSIKGTLVAKLDFNPAAGDGAISGDVFVSPKRRYAGKETRAKGTFAGQDKVFNGTISLSQK